MIKIFKSIRQSLIMKNQTGKPAFAAGRYFKYAIGEIILVVIGILFALQINNWNEESKNRVKEKEALENVKIALESDLKLYEDIFQPRFDRKKAGLDFYMKAAIQETSLTQDSLIHYFGRMGTDIFFRNDTGPYDALKSAGFELIKNKELRKLIINTYEVNLPAFTRFINDYTDEQLPLVQEYRKDLLSHYVVKKEDGNLDVWRKIKVKNLIKNPSFLSLLSIENNKYYNYMNRMRAVKKNINGLIDEIDKELKK